jgi:hypothetical protein
MHFLPSFLLYMLSPSFSLCLFVGRKSTPLSLSPSLPPFSPLSSLPHSPLFFYSLHDLLQLAFHSSDSHLLSTTPNSMSLPLLSYLSMYFKYFVTVSTAVVLPVRRDFNTDPTVFEDMSHLSSCFVLSLLNLNK